MPKYQPRVLKITGSNNNKKEGQITLHYPMLSRNNYATWAIKMKVFMRDQGVWDVVELRIVKTVVKVKKDKMALATIYQGITKDMLLSLAEKQTTKELWDVLKTRFLGADRVKTARIQTLKAEFETLSMKDTKVVDEFVVKVSNIMSNIRTLMELLKNHVWWLVKKLLRAIPPKFLQIASSLEQFRDLDVMTV